MEKEFKILKAAQNRSSLDFPIQFSIKFSGWQSGENCFSRSFNRRNLIKFAELTIKRLHVSQERIDYEAISQLNFLEELYINLALGYQKLDVKNVKKLVIYGQEGGLNSSNEFSDRVLKNHPNIVDFTWGPRFYLGDIPKKQLTQFLKTLKSLKRFCCSPCFFRFAQIEDIMKTLKILVNGAGALETLAIRIVIEDKKSKEIKQMIAKYFCNNRPSL